MTEHDALLRQKNEAVHLARLKQAEAAKLAETAADLEYRLYEARQHCAAGIPNLVSAASLFFDAGLNARGFAALKLAITRASDHSNFRLLGALTRELAYRRQVEQARRRRDKPCECGTPPGTHRFSCDALGDEPDTE